MTKRMSDAQDGGYYPGFEKQAYTANTAELVAEINERIKQQQLNDNDTVHCHGCTVYKQKRKTKK